MNAAILIGGSSRRMGADKTGLLLDAETLVERAVRVLRPFVNCVVLAGKRERPVELSRTSFVPDHPDFDGPAAGLVAVVAHDPASEWLVVGCDMPAFDERGVQWIIDHHFGAAPDESRRPAPGSPGSSRFPAATLGLLPGRGRPEPLLAIYSGSIARGIPAIASGVRALQDVADAIGAHIVPAPLELEGQWLNVNTQEEWQAFLASRQTPHGWLS